MPNWVRTRIVGANMEALKTALLSTDEKTGDFYVDFNKIKPIPTDLLNTQAPAEYAVPSKLFPSAVRDERIIKQQPVTMALKQAFGKFYKKSLRKPFQAEFVQLVKNNKPIIQEMYRIGNFNKGFEDSNFLTHVEEMAKGFYNNEVYGFTDWYEWSVCNWGSKWNASETTVDETGIYFTTAWSLAHPIMLELAKITPIRVCFADEDIGYNCGMIDFFLNENGDIDEEEIMGESVELASEVWGYGTVDVYDSEKDDWIEDETDERYIKAQEKYQATVDKICDLMTVESVIKDRVGV